MKPVTWRYECSPPYRLDDGWYFALGGVAFGPYRNVARSERATLAIRNGLIDQANDRGGFVTIRGTEWIVVLPVGVSPSLPGGSTPIH